MKIIAHRGAVAHHDENTLKAIVKAVNLPFDGVEFDVRATRDGDVILMHDATINRTTDGRGRVSMLTAKELAAVRTHDGQTVPSLAAVMKHLEKTTKAINIEIKSHGCAAQVASYARRPNVYVSSPIRSALEEVMAIEPAGRYGLVVSNPVKLLVAARSQRYAFLTIHKSLVNAKIVRYLYKYKQQAWVFTAKSQQHLSDFQDLAVHAAFSDIEP